MTPDMTTIEGRLAAARMMFEAAVQGCVQNGMMPSELLYLWTPSPEGRGVMNTLILPPCANPALRPRAVQALAKAHGATVAFLVFEVQMQVRELLEDGGTYSFGDVVEGVGDDTGLMGVLMTGGGDAIYLALRHSENAFSDIHVTGELVGSPSPIPGSLSNLLRVGPAADTTFH